MTSRGSPCANSKLLMKPSSLSTLGDVFLQTRSRHVNALVVSNVGVANSREHIRDGIGNHCHTFVATSTKMLW